MAGPSAAVPSNNSFVSFDDMGGPEVLQFFGVQGLGFRV